MEQNQGNPMDFQMPRWEEIPDLGLYMDQVVLYVQRTCEGLYGAEESRRLLTPAMVNNYVKAGLIPRPSGKKYSREQLAAILMIVQLKGVLSMDMIRLMLGGDGTQALYDMFCERQHGALRAFENCDPLLAATEASIYALACERLLRARQLEQQRAEAAAQENAKETEGRKKR